MEFEIEKSEIAEPIVITASKNKCQDSVQINCSKRPCNYTANK